MNGRVQDSCDDSSKESPFHFKKEPSGIGSGLMIWGLDLGYMGVIIPSSFYMRLKFSITKSLTTKKSFSKTKQASSS